jgi:hypothetical protein
MVVEQFLAQRSRPTEEPRASTLRSRRLSQYLLLTFVGLCEQIARPIKPSFSHRTPISDPLLQDRKACRLDAASAYPPDLLGVHHSAFL